MADLVETPNAEPLVNGNHQYPHQVSSSHDRSTPTSNSSGRKRSGSNSLKVEQIPSTDHTTDQETGNEPWKGWAELENDPLIFTHLLRNWGVSDVNVDEVIPLDAIFDKRPDSILGLIFLSRWTPSGVNEERVQPPPGLWFANQISTFSCATLALMNIINNRPDLDLGTTLGEFKQATTPMSPKARGFALDDLQFVKDIHNSFSRELDHMIVDLQLKEDFQAAQRTRKRQKKKQKRKKALREDDDNGFHFIAYVPFGGQVWKLDGTEALPQQLGRCNTASDWLQSSVADIQAQMEDPEASAMEFSCLSLTHEPDSNVDSVDEVKVERMKEDWSSLISHMLELHAEKGDIESLLG